MKKLLFLFACISLAAAGIKAQQSSENNASKRFRFGLRITPQPTWFTTNDLNITTQGAKFGFGFGLNMEYKLTDVASFLTGIGGDFEGGKYSYKYDPGKYSVYYELNETGEFTKPVNGIDLPKGLVKKTTNTGYLLKSRVINATYVTIPVILKLSTAEYSGVKYFGMFGGEIGFRAKAVASDSYYATYSYGKDTTLPVVGDGSTLSKLDIGGFKGDAAAGLVRVGLNVGLGAEYRIGGTTSFFGSINFFRGFTNFMRRESDFLIYKSDVSGGKVSNSFIKQNLIFNAVRINMGFMF